mmetsp:Transcript_40869/g.55661  ORF Transcript_40869/g.55661 Transcript_40869/m.55661 type:complete len:241 (-) Transcript_40869:80-802(-)
MVVIHVGHNRGREGRTRIYTGRCVLLPGDAPSPGKTPHEGDLKNVFHSVHLKIAELRPIRVRMGFHVGHPGCRLGLPFEHLHRPHERRARVRCTLERCFCYTKRSPFVVLEILRVSAHPTEAENGCPRFIHREADDGAEGEARCFPGIRNRGQRREAQRLFHESADLFWPAQALARVLVRSDSFLPRGGFRVHLGHAFDYMTTPAERVLLLVLLFELDSSHGVARSRANHRTVANKCPTR